ncbi:hypothetical protein C5167_019562 [Papaver somniferum]|uniref:Uncharacterized protein n=1 Tax=Papaver somniferum TaxID=3469 RepID=A0A4Y7IQI7_PAPSO|nr:uncharacterized protein LOC113353890 isoform X2 [Papaver somniferum]RZC51144.1 hypothetical protein C5167_019562 [Papaver somniferum]
MSIIIVIVYIRQPVEVVSFLSPEEEREKERKRILGLFQSLRRHRMARSSDEEYMPGAVEEAISDLEVEFVPESPLRGSDIVSGSVGLRPSQRAGRPKFLAELDDDDDDDDGDHDDDDDDGDHHDDDDEQVEQEYTGNWLSDDAGWLSFGARTKVIILPNGVEKNARCKRGKKYNDPFEKLIDEHYVARILCEMSAIVPHVPGEILLVENQPLQLFQLDAQDENFAQETPSPVGSNEDGDPIAGIDDQEKLPTVGGNEDGDPIAGPSHGSIHES